MDTVVTLICNPATPAIDDVVRKRAIRASAEALKYEASQDLSSGVACDLYFKGKEVQPRETAAAIRAALMGAPVDVVVQPAQARRKRLLVADMDSTIIEQECLDELADFAGKRAEIAAITERAMRGELNFEAALLERLAMLKGLPGSALAETFEKRITLRDGARTLVQTMRKFGARTALVSGGFTFFTSRVAAAAGFHTHDSNELIIEDGAIAGDVARPIRGREAKEQVLRREAERHGIPLAETMAVGDGANDLAMLARAGIGVAFHAKPAVAEAAAARIDHGDLTALLFIQGIAEYEFA
jgi:phosphoserine phosphatase